MATAKRVSPPPPEDTIVLELTPKEASYLRWITGWTVDGHGPWERVNYGIWAALSRAVDLPAPLPKTADKHNGANRLVLDD